MKYDLTLNQEFEVRQHMTSIKDASKESLLELVEMALRQNMRQLNAARELTEKAIIADIKAAKERSV
jgi:hypothetical protein